MKNTIPIIIDSIWLEKEKHPFRFVGFCNNREITFYTSGFGVTWWFEASTTPWRGRDEVSNGDKDYYCVSNEGSDNEEKLTLDECKQIIGVCCKKFVSHIVKINSHNCSIEKEPVSFDPENPSAMF